MPHPHSLRLLDAWRRRQEPDGRPPVRTALSPLLFGGLLPQMFVLARDGPEDGGGFGRPWRFRTAGALLDDLCGRPLAGAPFAALWEEADRAAALRALGCACDRGRPRVVTCRGETAGGRIAVLELTLAPATGPSGTADRCVGLLQPVSPLARLAGEPLRALRLDAPPPGPRLVVDNPRPARLRSTRADVAER